MAGEGGIVNFKIQVKDIISKVNIILKILVIIPMKKTAYSLLFLLLLIPEPGLSQEQKRQIIYHSYTYEIGANWLKENNQFSIVHKGAINGLTYRFEKSGKNYNEISVSLRYSKLKANLKPKR